MNVITFEIEDLAQQMQEIKKNRAAGKRKQGCTLLIGAGCSITGNIPGAKEIIKTIQKDSIANKRVDLNKLTPEEHYPAYMSAYPPSKRQQLFEEVNRCAKINKAHLYIASLMEAGYVHRVMSVNFDDLLVRACALVHLFPSIYDLTVAPSAVGYGGIDQQALFYLHGQLSGYSLKNTYKETQEQAGLLSKLINFEEDEHLWLVVGYSGVNDALFQRYFKSVKEFRGQLFWSAYEESEDTKTIKDILFNGEKYASYMCGLGADEFFHQLANQLGVEAPAFLGDPFEYVDGLLNKITLPKAEGSTDPIQTVRDQIAKAKQLLQNAETSSTPHAESTPEETSAPEPKSTGKPVSVLDANFQFMQGNYDKVISLYEEADSESKTKIQSVVASAYFQQGYALQDRAEKESSVQEKERLFRESFEKYRLAIEIKPDYHEAFNNRGIVLSHLARTQEGEERERLFGESFEKYRRATEIKPDKHEAFSNWGNALARLARTQEGEERERLFGESFEKYRRAIEIKPDFHEAFYNWGVALSDLAQTQEGEEKERLFGEAIEKYRLAIEIKPEDHEAFYNLACLMSLQGKADECRTALEEYFAKGGNFTRAFIENDTDFENVRHYDWFEELLKKAPER